MCCGGPPRNASAISGSSRAGSATPQPPKTSVRPSREREMRCAVAPEQASRPDDAEQRHASPRRRASPSEMPAAATRTMPLTASGRRHRSAERDERRRASGRPRAPAARPPPSATARTASAKGSRLPARFEAARGTVAGQLGDDDPPLGRRARARRARQFEVEAPEPVHEDERRALAADEVAEPRSGAVRSPLLESEQIRVWTPSASGAYSSRDECFWRAGRMRPVGTTIEGDTEPV